MHQYITQFHIISLKQEMTTLLTWISCSIYAPNVPSWPKIALGIFSYT